MELKLAHAEPGGKPKSISHEKLLEAITAEKSAIFYFDKSNAHKDLMEYVKFLENNGLRAYLKEVKYGLDQEDYLYQMHIF
ncbi:MAG: hypothetical protein LBU73_06230 [Helicobacteraceae bacterium]|jgi:hypothetical protein|nr:hypothetical protein [Helicobacteraceae bacterium]